MFLNVICIKFLKLNIKIKSIKDNVNCIVVVIN